MNNWMPCIGTCGLDVRLGHYICPTCLRRLPTDIGNAWRLAHGVIRLDRRPFDEMVEVVRQWLAEH